MLVPSRTSIPLALLMASCLFAQTPPSAFEKDPWPAVNSGPLKVFILAGQSNMQGHASLRTLEYLIYNEDSAAKYQHWKDREGRWTARNDVWIWTTDGNRFGSLTPGFGASEMKLGPELGFGWVVGEAIQDQVLLIKTCWGGRSIRRDFLPPSAELPTDAEFEAELARLQKRNPDATIDDVKAPYGKAYRDMIASVKEVLEELETRFPAYESSRGYELAGFVWFQGWNDLVDGQQREDQYADYTDRLATLIGDVRRELAAPNLPVIIGELGANGKRGDFQAAQKAVTSVDGIGPKVRLIETCEYWDPEVEALVADGVWKGKDWVKFYNLGSDRGYHYLGSAKIYYQMGSAFGQGMLELLND